MEYLIHIIDESSQHKKLDQDNQEFQIIEGISENGESGEIVRSDSVYLINDNSVIDAIVSLANVILIKDSNNKSVPLSSVLSQSNMENENSSIEDDTFIPLKTSKFKFVENTNSELIKTSCQIKRTNNEETWIELHNIYFYVIPRDKIIFVK